MRLWDGLEQLDNRMKLNEKFDQIWKAAIEFHAAMNSPATTHKEHLKHVEAVAKLCLESFDFGNTAGNTLILLVARIFLAKLCHPKNALKFSCFLTNQRFLFLSIWATNKKIIFFQ